MPRSVNSVASRARRKKLLNKQRVISDVEKTFGQLQKMPLKKDFNTHTEIEELKKEILEHYG